MNIKKPTWVLFAFLAIAIGIYPLTYLILDMQNNGLLTSKSPELLSSNIYNLGFYTHIYLGGIALLIGWSQFSKKWRKKHLNTHRTIGKAYVVAALLSGLAGLYISFYASGGIETKLGFGLLAVFWLITTSNAFISIKNKNIKAHQKWMIRSYALCFAAVTLRLWMPILPAIFNLEFSESYAIISWLCWVPNLIFAEILIRRTVLV